MPNPQGFTAPNSQPPRVHGSFWELGVGSWELTLFLTRGLRFLGTRGAENIAHRVIAFVAGVLE